MLEIYTQLVNARWRDHVAILQIRFNLGTGTPNDALRRWAYQETRIFMYVELRISLVLHTMAVISVVPYSTLN